MDELKDYIDYDPNTGVFRWKVNYYGNKLGSSPRPTHSEGYIRVQFKGKRYFMHKVAFYWTYGYLPDQVDHINRNTSDNRISNLRAATQAQNSCNKGARGKSKYRGVYWHNKNRKWVTSLRKEGVSHYVGCFECEIEAAKAYNEKAKELHGEFASLNDV